MKQKKQSLFGASCHTCHTYTVLQKSEDTLTILNSSVNDE